MLPRPTVKYFPRIMQKDAKAITLSNKMDTHITAWEKDVLDMKRFVRADECPATLLKELDYLLYARVKDTDSETVKRQKIAGAIASHKFRSTWQYDARYRIQNITGISPNLYVLTDSDDNIRMAHLADDPDKYWGTRAGLTGEAIDDFCGEWRVGAMDEPVVAGNRYIDLVSSTITSDELDLIVAELKDDCFPAYMRGYLGYVSAPSYILDPRLILHSRLEDLTSVVGSAWTDDIGLAYSPGKFGNAIVVPYAKATGDMFKNTITQLNEGAFEFWIKLNWSWDGLNTSDARDHVICHWTSGGDTIGHYIQFMNGVALQWGRASAGSLNEVGTAISASTLTHIAVTWSLANNRQRFWINGVKTTEAAYSDVIAGAFNMSLGYYWGTNYGLGGVMDNPKFWNYEKDDFSDRNTEYSYISVTGGWNSYGRIIY